MENLVGIKLSVDKMDEDDNIVFSGMILVLVQSRNTVVGVNVENPFPSVFRPSYSGFSGLNTFDLNQVESEYDQNEKPEDNIVLLRTISTALSDRANRNTTILKDECEYTISLVQNVLVQIEQVQHKTKLDKAIEILRRLEEDENGN